MQGIIYKKQKAAPVMVQPFAFYLLVFIHYRIWYLQNHTMRR